MSAAPNMPLFLDAYLADTTHLSTEEHGAYLLLLMSMWRRGGAVPNDDKDLARIVGLSPSKWRAVKTRLLPFLVVSEGEISQKRLKKEWEYVQEKREKNAQNGARGGRPASNKNNGIAKANGYPVDNPNADNPTPTLVVKEEPNGSSKKRGSRLPDDWQPDELFAAREGLSSWEISREAEKFVDYWRELPGQRGVKLDWAGTWRNWVRKAAGNRKSTVSEPIQRRKGFGFG